MLSSFSDQVQGEQAYQSAVLLSNQSNCIFEQGLYEKSIAVAHRCIMLLEEETFPFLEGNANSSKEEELKQYENLKLKINCGLHFYDNKIITKPQLWNTNVAETLHCLAGCGDTAYEKQARQMVDQSRIWRKFLLNNNKNDGKFTSISNELVLPPIHRAFLNGSSVYEYFQYGNGMTAAALGEGCPVEQGSNEPLCPLMELAKLPEDHLSTLSLLFGDGGDVRHVYRYL